MRTLDQRGGRRWVIGTALVFLTAMLALPWLGPGPLDVHRVLRRQAPDFGILVQLRISRTLLALFAGGALSLGGTLFQAMLRDALATPYTMGISAGAALGAVIVLSAGWQTAARPTGNLDRVINGRRSRHVPGGRRFDR